MANYRPAHGGASCPRRRQQCPIYPSQLFESAIKVRLSQLGSTVIEVLHKRAATVLPCRCRVPAWALRVILCSPRPPREQPSRSLLHKCAGPPRGGGVPALRSVLVRKAEIEAHGRQRCGWAARKAAARICGTVMQYLDTAQGRRPSES